MSNHPAKDTLIAAIGAGVQSLQDATDALDQAVSERLGVNRTDLRLLSILQRSGPVTLGELGQAARLSKPAMTTAADRLERAGFVRRKECKTDRRAAIIVMTDLAVRHAREIYGPLAAEGTEILRRSPPRDLRAIRRFLEQAEALQTRHLDRIRAQK